MVAMTADLGAQVPVAPAVGGAGDRVRICTVQFAARPPAEAAGVMRQFIEKAAADGARLVVFPALTMPGGQAVEKAMGDTAAKARITVVTGVREIGPGGASDNRAVAFDPSGRVVARRQKGDPAASPGVFDVGFGRMALILGGEVASPERHEVLKRQNVDLLVWLSDRPDPVDAPSVEMVMLRTGASIAASNGAAGGGSLVAEWPRSILNVAKNAGETTVFADVSFGPSRTARTGEGAAPSAAAIVPTPALPPVQPPDEPIDESKLIPREWLHWHADPSTAMVDARRQGKKIIVYFDHPDPTRSAWIETRIFRDKDVATIVGGGYILAKVNMNTQAPFAARLGVFKGGVVNVYGTEGAYMGQVANIKSPKDLIALLSK